MKEKIFSFMRYINEREKLLVNTTALATVALWADKLEKMISRAEQKLGLHADYAVLRFCWPKLRAVKTLLYELRSEQEYFDMGPGAGSPDGRYNVSDRLEKRIKQMGDYAKKRL